MLKITVSSLCAVVMLSAAASRPVNNSVVVKTVEGPVRGEVSRDAGVVSFKGLPYAAPPIGTLRWRPPQPARPRKSVYKADHFGPSCMQGPNREFGPYTKEFLRITPPGEDCLYLNVWMPKRARPHSLPVLFFIHGGAFTSGSGDVPVYDGQRLAEMGMVVVTVNYRLGVFGFMAHPELSAENENKASGNYGLLDQIAALRWLQENISGFGGDPQRVTIAGQSAGASSVEDLLASPLATGLFRGAIADSGIGVRFIPPRTQADAEQSGVRLQQALNANSIAEMRQLTAESLLQKQPAFGLGPVIDGWVLPSSPDWATTISGNTVDVPVITGFQQGDTALIPSLGRATATEYEGRVRQAYGDLSGEFLSLYPGGTDADVRQSIQSSSQDKLRAGASLWAAQRHNSHKSMAWAYYFARAIPWPQHPEFGAFHTGEIPYTFGTQAVLDRPWETADREISKDMMAYWYNFASRGNPNGDGLPAWPPSSLEEPALLQIEEKPEAGKPLSDRKLAFWRGYFSRELNSSAAAR